MNLWLNQSYLHFVKLIYKIYSISMMHIKTGKDNCKEFSRMAGEVLNIEVAQKSILKPSKLCTTNALASLSPQRRTETFQEEYQRYIEETGLAIAFKIVFAEILSKKILEDAAFIHATTRLRQIGDDIAYIQNSKYKKVQQSPK